MGNEYLVEMPIGDYLADWRLSGFDPTAPDCRRQEVLGTSAKEVLGLRLPNPLVCAIGIERLGKIAPDRIAKNGYPGLSVFGRRSDEPQAIAEQDIVADGVWPDDEDIHRNVL